MPAFDTFADVVPSITAPPRHHAAVTPNDEDDLEYVTRALYIGGAGTVRVVTVEGETADYVCPAGKTLIIRAARVMDTGTDATAIVAQW